MLTSADYWGSQGGQFGDVDDWTLRALSRGEECYLHPQLFLTECQLRIARAVVKKTAILEAFLVVWMETDIGRLSVHTGFNIGSHLVACP